MKHFFLLAISLLLSVVSQAQVKVGEATLPEVVNFQDNELVLNGAGIREKLWFDLYAAGLYLGAKNHDEQAIINTDQPMSIKMEILSNLITTKKLLEAFKSGIEKTNSVSEVKRLKAKQNKFLSFITNEITIGNVYDLVYTPGVGTELYEDSKLLGTIKGHDFKKLLFNIWLAKKPVDEGLKSGLLGDM